ncbi:ABC transporter permease [Rhizobium sp. FKL33]|uniref:ABC transporter permease n=1 Tax=Rhizobium sp. FKL33 TaxID=2562307 RepID=UPI0010BF9DF8|nr:ABC transporter permease [Rhizobium sp. FKL33]
MTGRNATISKTLVRETLRALTALGIALVIAFLIVAATSTTPVETFGTLLSGPLTSKRTIGLWVDDIAKLTVTGLAFSLVFQARQFAMGVQGQVYIGGLFAALVALSPVGSTWAGMPLAVVAAMIGGAMYGFIPGYAKAKLGANEIVSSLMLNYIAINLVTYLARGPLVAGPGLLSTADFPDGSVFPALIARTRVDLGLILALVATAATWFALYRTTWGLKLRLVGHNARFADYAGIKATFIMVSAMTASGALGGLLGAMFVQGQSYGKLTVLFEGNLAFEGILIAIVAKSRPLAVPIVAIFYGYLRQGALIMGIRTDVPTEVISVVQAIIILLVASSFSLGGKTWLARLKSRATAKAGGAKA